MCPSRLVSSSPIPEAGPDRGESYVLKGINKKYYVFLHNKIYVKAFIWYGVLSNSFSCIALPPTQRLIFMQPSL